VTFPLGPPRRFAIRESLTRKHGIHSNGSYPVTRLRNLRERHECLHVIARHKRMSRERGWNRQMSRGFPRSDR